MMEDKTVEILGTEYKIFFDVPEKELPQGADGCFDQTIRAIKIAKFEPDRNSVADLEAHRKKVLRHEIIHAFYMNQECGITAVLLKHGGRMKQLLIGLLFSYQKFTGHSKKLIAYEYKCPNESRIPGS